MAQDPQLDHPVVAPAPSAEAGKPNDVDEATGAPQAEVDTAYWIACMEDAERAERDWRTRGRQIVQLYRNQSKNSKGNTQLGKTTFNILYSNTEVMLPNIYSKPPDPVVKSRFVRIAEPPAMMPPGMMPGGVPLPPGAGPPPPSGPLPGAPPAGPPAPPLAGPPAGPVPPMGAEPSMGGLPPPDMMGPPPMPPGMPLPAPGRPPQEDIETAASIMQAALKIVTEDEHSDEAVKAAVKDMLLPGRGVCRVRWRPEMKSQPVMAGDGITPLPPPQEGGEAPTEEVKVWEEVGDEYVYWEDLLVDPVRVVADMNWIAFRHLFTKEGLDDEFADSPVLQEMKAAGQLDRILKWTDESAAKSPVGGGSAMKSAATLGGHIKKAMVWEIWDRRTRRVIWFIREAEGIVLRVDPDSYQLMGFYPIPAPLLAVTTTDTRVPRPYYDLYAKLADDLDTCCVRIGRLIDHIRVRGAYNSSSPEVADILTAADNTMLGVAGVDLMSGGLSNHLWLVPIDMWMAALDKLLIGKEHLKQSIYEVMGISDIMRGSTKASETATAQRIKGTMGVTRLEDAKAQAANFARDLLRLKAEIIGQNFSPETLEAMTGEKVTPGVLEILRSDFQRMCAIDIEDDSTVAVDEQAEQQSMAQVMTAIQSVMMGVQAMLQTQFLPPQQVIQLGLELLKMFLHPIRFSRPVVQLITDFQEQLKILAMMPPPPMATGMPMPGPGQPGPEGPPPAEQPPPQTNGAAPPLPFAA